MLGKCYCTTNAALTRYTQPAYTDDNDVDVVNLLCEFYASDDVNVMIRYDASPILKLLLLR